MWFEFFTDNIFFFGTWPEACSKLSCCRGCQSSLSCFLWATALPFVPAWPWKPTTVLGICVWNPGPQGYYDFRNHACFNSSLWFWPLVTSFSFFCSWLFCKSFFFFFWVMGVGSYISIMFAVGIGPDWLSQVTMPCGDLGWIFRKNIFVLLVKSIGQNGCSVNDAI